MDHPANITESDLDSMLFDEAAEPRALPFSLLEKITNGFSSEMEIGRGGFAAVYKGILKNGAVAIKRLENTYMYKNEFIGEVDSLMKVKHRNIVRILGYCVDTQGNMLMHEGKFVIADIQQRLLCFEYMPNGGLDGYIKDPSCGLNWRDRYDIIKGICEGVHHLHKINMVHLDLKPANILLDENLEPKITDFGISRSFEQDQTSVTTTKVVGTMGYMAPEFLSHVITQKYDLYSLGVIILEILTGEKGCQDVNNVVKIWSDRLGISEGTSLSEQIRVCAEIGMECIEMDPVNRPASMKHIIERLAQTESTEDCSRRIKILDMGTRSPDRIIYSLDTNQAKKWIITGEDGGRVRIYNYETQKKIYSFKLSDGNPVMCVKFIERKQWFAAAAHGKEFHVHVYSYETKMKRIKSLVSYDGRSNVYLTVHPTRPYLVKMGEGSLRYWNWDADWDCKIIRSDRGISQKEGYLVTFSSEGTMVCALDNYHNYYRVKVWNSIESAVGKEYEDSFCILTLHTSRVNCMDFIRCGAQESLVTGSNDHTAKIWDVHKKICLYKLEMKSPVTSILYQPDLQILITGSEDGYVHSWRTAGFSTYSRYYRRPKETVNVGGGVVQSLACLMGRVVIGKQDEVAIMDVVSVDYAKESMDIKQDGDETSKVTAGSSSELPILDVHPLQLCFPCEPNMSFPCSLQLTNNTDEPVAFRIIEKNGKSIRGLTSMLDLYGTLRPKDSVTWVVTPEEAMKLAKETDFDLVLQSTEWGDAYLFPFFESESEHHAFFEEALEMGHRVHEVSAFHAPQGDMISEPALLVLQGMKITSVTSTNDELCSIYVHPTERWIITGHANGDLRTWNQEAKKPMNSFKLSGVSVCAIKFIAIEKWIVAGTSDGFVHLFDYVSVTEMPKIKTLTCKTAPNSWLHSLDVHPVQPYVLATTMDHWWYMKKGWKHGGDFSPPLHRANQVKFRPDDSSEFASAEKDGSIMYWDFRYGTPRHTLLGHKKAVNCLDYFTRRNVHYLISGSDDCTAKIWNVQDRLRQKSKKDQLCTTCIDTLNVKSPVISVLALPGRLVTGSKSGTVQFWSSTDFRLERKVQCFGGGPVRGLVCSMASRWIVIGQEKTITIMDLGEDAAASEDAAPSNHTELQLVEKKHTRWWHIFTAN